MSLPANPHDHLKEQRQLYIFKPSWQAEGEMKSENGCNNIAQKNDCDLHTSDILTRSSDCMEEN